MPTHNLQCSACKLETLISRSPWDDNLYCEGCGGKLEILWTASSTPRVVSVHPSERAVVWERPSDGQIRWPGQNNIDMPERYRVGGFERREFATRRELEQFEKSHNVCNEKLWFNTSTAPD